MLSNVSFEIINEKDIELIIPMVRELSSFKVSEAQLKQRLQEMFNQNYECAVIKHKSEFIGLCGMWFCTRHYSGKSVEIDHVFIKEKYRQRGLGKRFMDWVHNYVKEKDVEAIELNTYLQNEASHRFYEEQGFRALAYHFVKPLNGKWPQQ